MTKDCSVARKSKYLLLNLDRGLLTMHFRFDGQLMWLDYAKDLLRRAHQPNPNGVHVDVALELDKGVLWLRGCSSRHFGCVNAWESLEDCVGLATLGVDATSKGFTATRFLQRL